MPAEHSVVKIYTDVTLIYDSVFTKYIWAKTHFSFFPYLPGSPRRHQQWDSQATSAGRRGPESLHERPSALPHAELGFPAPVLSPTLPANLPAVSGPLLARQRSILPQLPARPTAATAPGLAGPAAGSGERPAASAPQLAPPVVPGVSQGSAPTIRPRHRYGTVGLYPYPWNTSIFRRRSGEAAFTWVSFSVELLRFLKIENRKKKKIEKRKRIMPSLTVGAPWVPIYYFQINIISEDFLK